jgi:hypothetical protein
MLKRWMRRLPLQFQDLQFSNLLRDWIGVQLKEGEWAPARAKLLFDLDVLAKVRSVFTFWYVAVLIATGHECKALRSAAGCDRAQAR